MDQKLIDEYRRIRAKHPNMSAKGAMHWARGRLTPRIFDVVPGRDGMVYTIEPGVSLLFTVERDQDTNLWDSSDDVTHSIHDAEGEAAHHLGGKIRYRGVTYLSLDVWQGHGGRGSLAVDLRDYLRAEAMAAYYNKGGESKQVAFEHGMRQQKQVLEYWRGVAQGDIDVVGVVVQLLVNGDDRDQEAVWGIDYDAYSEYGTYRLLETADELAQTLIERFKKDKVDLDRHVPIRRGLLQDLIEYCENSTLENDPLPNCVKDARKVMELP